MLNQCRSWTFRAPTHSKHCIPNWPSRESCCVSRVPAVCSGRCSNAPEFTRRSARRTFSTQSTPPPRDSGATATPAMRRKIISTVAIALLVACLFADARSQQQQPETRTELWSEADVYVPLNEKWRLFFRYSLRKAEETREDLESTVGA